MQVEHPAEWELTIVSGLEGPGRCVFADRLFQRMDLRWRALRYVPKLDLVLSKHLKDGQSQEHRPTSLVGGPAQWRGLLRKTPQGTIVHAGRFFRASRWLAEVTLVWPRQRDQDVENAILASVQPQDPQAPVCLWQALGLSVTVGREFQLYQSEAKVGRLSWSFRTEGKNGPLLTVERIAMPDYWLREPLRDWLAEEALPQGYRIQRQEMSLYNGHRGERLISFARAGTVAALRSRRKVRLDLAWQCPVENRLYRIHWTELTPEQEVSVPGHLAVRCCQKAPVIGASQASG